MHQIVTDRVLTKTSNRVVVTNPGALPDIMSVYVDDERVVYDPEKKEISGNASR